MKSRQKITRVQLESETRNDYSLLGIVSAEPDYRLSLSINKALRISLKNDKPLEVTGLKKGEQHFSKFTDHSVGHEISYNLISNKSGNEFLLSRLKKIDYIFQVYSPENDFELPAICASLRAIESITAVFVLDPTEIKDKNLQYLIP